MSDTDKKAYNEFIKGILPNRCVLNAGKCSLVDNKIRRDQLILKQPFAFVMRPYSSDCLDMELACKDLIKIEFYIAKNATTSKAIFEKEADSPTSQQIATILAKDDSFIGSGYCQICSLCLYSFFGVAELGHLNPNVFLEIGMMFAFSKPVIFTLDTKLTSIQDVPFDLTGLLLVPYRNTKELREGLTSKISAVMSELEKKGLC